MSDKDASKINIGRVGINLTRSYRSTDLVAHFEIDEATAARINIRLLSRGRDGERPRGFKVGRYVFVRAYDWCDAYLRVVESLEQSSQRQRS